MKLSLSCDHILIVKGSEFLQTLKSYLENPVMRMVYLDWIILLIFQYIKSIKKGKQYGLPFFVK